MPLKFSPPILALAMLLLAASAQAQGFPPRPPGDVDYPPPGAPQPYPGPQQYPGQQQYPPQQYPQSYPPQGQGQRQDPRGMQSQPLPPPPFERQNTKRNPPPKAPDAAGPPPAAPKSKANAKQPAPSGDAPEAAEVPVEQAPIPRISNPTAVFSGLDKITGRIITFDAAIDETVQFGALQVTPRACYTRPATEIQNTTSFVEVDEITLAGDIKRIFTGWMFANSPGLHAVEHPIYDVWIKDCKTTPPAVAVPGKKE